VNLPNTLSLLRILLVTPFLIAVIYKQYALALTIFVIAGFTDFLDGFLARRLGQKSVLGAFLDPLGDKLLTPTAFISLCLQGFLPSWLAVMVVAKDIYIVLGAGILHFSGNLSTAIPSLWGKLSTLVQILTICVTLLSAFHHLSTSLLDVLFIITGLVTVIALFYYLVYGIRAFLENPCRNER